ncbi:hypothetical protein N4R57_01760 [Rhodobacteraceae bacterium D3-12]|nr:hypothetical protein N4R57_01760 [Rhodobacteraceae bacterium D3-12]
MYRIFALLFVVVLILTMVWHTQIRADTAADLARSAPAELRPVIRNILRSPVHDKALRTCPADVFPKSQSYPFGTTSCGANPMACYKACLKGDGKACFGLARVLEKSDSDPNKSKHADYSDFTYTLFLAACQNGNANACTNAAATSKNGKWLRQQPDAARKFSCQMRTYTASCEAGAAWGCYMKGSLHSRNDAGRYKSRAQSEAAYRRACKLSPTSNACLSRYR